MLVFISRFEAAIPLLCWQSSLWLLTEKLEAQSAGLPQSTSSDPTNKISVQREMFSNSTVLLELELYIGIR